MANWKEYRTYDTREGAYTAIQEMSQRGDLKNVSVAVVKKYNGYQVQTKYNDKRR